MPDDDVCEWCDAELSHWLNLRFFLYKDGIEGSFPISAEDKAHLNEAARRLAERGDGVPRATTDEMANLLTNRITRGESTFFRERCTETLNCYRQTQERERGA